MSRGLGDVYKRQDKSNSKDLLVLVDELQPSASFDPKAAYLIALLVRGGVFSEKSTKADQE